MSAPSQKTVGVRRAALSNWQEVDRLLETAAGLRRAPLVPRGVYRFSTFEEAHAWMIRMTARTHARHALPISRASAAR
jgi:hypothetical protein